MAAIFLEVAEFQRQGIEWLAGRSRALLADEPGLGKTRQALLAARHVLRKVAGTTGIAHWVLVVCPANAVAVWAREADVCRLTVKVISKGTNYRPSHMPHVVVVSYDLFVRGQKTIWVELKRNFGYPLIVIADEAHYMKDIKSKRSIATSAAMISAQYSWCLTGTPIKNYYDEYFSLARIIVPYEALNAAGVSSYPAWRDKFCITETKTVYIRSPRHLSRTKRLRSIEIVNIVGNRNVDELKRLFGPYTLRRRKADVLPQLPMLHWQALPVEMVEKVDILTEDEQAMLIAAKTGQTPARPHVATVRAALASALVPHAYAEAIAHLEATTSPLVVFCCHLDAIDRLASMLRASRIGARVEVLTGATPSAERGRIQDRFQAGKVDVLIGQLHAAGTAITLTRANRALFIDLAWSPADNKQARDRIHRIGQKVESVAQYLDPVNVAIASRVNGILARKTAALDAVDDLGTAVNIQRS